MDQKFHENLISISITHSEVQDKFRKGCFPIKRQRNFFSYRSIDLALEQTMNAMQLFSALVASAQQ